LGVFAFPLLVAAHQGSEGRQEPVARYSDPGNNFFSNVPINELSTKAFRRFHRRFRDATTGEYWFKYAQGYQVSFILDRHHELAYYDPSGFFLSSVRYYDGKEVASDLGENVKRRFPDYKIDVVTEVNDGQKTSYILQIMNPDYIKVLTIIDGRIDIIKELTNGSAKIDPTEAVRW
jgi:disulfide oxidoreductase YuzD